MQISLTTLSERFNEKFSHYLNALQSSAPTILEAMKYSCLSPSKLIRPLIIYAVGVALEVPLEKLDSCAIAVELIHTYSLIHDDLPAMDNDDIRRGQPSCHIFFSEATAILAGDALQGLAIECLLEDPLLDDTIKNKLALHLLQATSYKGMIAGQSLDLELLTKPELSLETLKMIHLLKTACLLNTCFKLPLILGQNTSRETKKRLEQVGAILGLTFQIQDDYLDHYGDSRLLGKPQGSDSASNKKTFADFYSKEELEVQIIDQYDHALNILNIENSYLIREIVTNLKHRSH